MRKVQSKKFYLSLIIFSLFGQIAWVVENMYFNVFIYKMFSASAKAISIMVMASAITAAITTLVMGAVSDKVGSRKGFLCGGYILWGLSILAFAFVRMDILSKFTGGIVSAAALGCNLVIILDCVMTFFGSTANDACFNAWLTDMGDESNRGKIEGLNAMMPLVSILVVFGSFMAFDLNKADSWKIIYFIIGFVVIFVGILGFFIIDDSKSRELLKSSGLEKSNTFKNIFYSFKPVVVAENKILYGTLLSFAVFNISIQIFMPYLILYYEQTLQIKNYVLVLAPAIIVAAGVTAFYGRIYDKAGFKASLIPSLIFLIAGYLFLYFFNAFPFVFAGSLLMLTGFLSGMAVYGAMIRDNIPQTKSGMFQGVRIISQVLIPGVIGPAIGAKVLANADKIVNGDGTESFIPNRNIFLAAFIASLFIFVTLTLIVKLQKKKYCKLKLNDKTGEIPFSEYPRPAFVRDSFLNLNGTWDCGVKVPFPLESELSGFTEKIPDEYEYFTKFKIPEGFKKDRILLNFGAVDQIAEVFIDDNYVGTHEGGYLPFSFDITSQLSSSEEHKIRVLVKDGLNKNFPYGKQRKNRGGMWYTPVSGIWQTVWLESVSEKYIRGIKITPDLKGIHLEIQGDEKLYLVEIVDRTDGKITKVQLEETSAYIEIAEPKLWSPENPNLYDINIYGESDKVSSYFGLRTITTGKDENGEACILLNGKPYFFNGVLDQGYYPEGIFLPNSEKGWENDIIAMKKMGFNTLRKHIKIEAAGFYEACDRLGMIVFQDMVNNSFYSFFKDTLLPTLGIKKLDDRKFFRTEAAKKNFISSMKNTVSHLYNYPCVCYYTIFNEGWGQFNSDEMYELLKSLDSTRIIDSTSGWFSQNKSDVVSEHVYFKPIKIKKSDRPMIISEFGGYSFKEKNHVFNLYDNYGYKMFSDRKKYEEAVKKLYEEQIKPYAGKGLSGAIYTQLSDVEDETNGFLTYDRIPKTDLNLSIRI